MIQTFRIQQKTSGIYTATLKDETGTVIPLAGLSVLLLTLYNADVPEPLVVADNIINSRNLQNVLNQNNVTFHATSGLLTWTLQPADTTIVDETRKTELHVARFDFTYGTPTKLGAHEIKFRVENLRKVTS